MSHRTLLLLGKIWIIITLLASTFTLWIIGFSDRVWLSIIIIISQILLGTLLCIYASKQMPNEQAQQISVRSPLIRSFFQIVKWSTIVAFGFQLIAAILIAFFYFLNKEFEATLLVCFLSGIAIALIIQAVEYFKNYKN